MIISERSKYGLLFTDLSRTFSEYLLFRILQWENVHLIVSLVTPLVRFRRRMVRVYISHMPMVSAIMQSVSGMNGYRARSSGGLSFLWITVDRVSV